MRIPAFLAALIAVAASAPAPAQPDTIAAEVTLTRLTPDRWRVTYAFDAPVQELDLGPPAAAYREAAWRMETPGVALLSRDGHERIVARDSARARFELHVERYTAYAEDRYAPLIPFSDGGAALYLGYFTGEAAAGGRMVPVRYRFRFAAMPGEGVIAPDPGATGAYAYFGPQQPERTRNARLVVDPGTPDWLGETLVRVADATTRVLAERLGGAPAEPPLVLVGAGEVDAAEGASIKGGAVGGQFVMLLRGRALREETPARRAAFERITAHELVHLWQLHGHAEAYHPTEPWLHEGAAEAMAVEALEAAGLWSPAASAAFAERAAAACSAALEGAALPEAVARGRGGAVYPCGFGLYRGAAADPITVWSRLVEAVRGGAPYTHATLERVLRLPPE